MQNAVFSDSVLRIYGKLLFVFALLVSNAARGFASGLARSMAFAATAVLNGFGNVLGFDSLDSAHFKLLLKYIYLHLQILSHPTLYVNKFFAFFFCVLRF